MKLLMTKTLLSSEDMEKTTENKVFFVLEKTGFPGLFVLYAKN